MEVRGLYAAPLAHEMAGAGVISPRERWANFDVVTALPRESGDPGVFRRALRFAEKAWASAFAEESGCSGAPLLERLVERETARRFFAAEAHSNQRVDSVWPDVMGDH